MQRAGLVAYLYTTPLSFEAFGISTVSLHRQIPRASEIIIIIIGIVVLPRLPRLMISEAMVLG
jgi:hypothetical protein